MPTSVSRSSGGRKSSRIGAAGWRAAPRLASHRGDSGSRQDEHADQGRGRGQVEDPAPGIGRDVPDAGDLREHQDAAVQRRAHQPGHDRTRPVRPALGGQRHRVGPHAAHAQPHQEPQHEHLLLGPDQGPQAGEHGVEQDADPQRPGAPDHVAQVAQRDPAHRRAQHQRRGEACEPIAPERRRIVRTEQALRHRQRGHRHQTQFDTVEQQRGDGSQQHGESSRTGK